MSKLNEKTIRFHMNAAENALQNARYNLAGAYYSPRCTSTLQSQFAARAKFRRPINGACPQGIYCKKYNPKAPFMGRCYVAQPGRVDFKNQSCRLRPQSWYRNKEYNGATNRAYYAFFYAASAILLTRDISRSKHSGVLSTFRQYFVKPGLIEVEYSETYGHSIADYWHIIMSQQ
jgi:hypothetical protein